MPPIQILPQVPNFGSQLAQVLGQAGTNIGQGLVQRHQNTQDQKILESITESSSPMDVIKKFGALSSERQKTMSPVLQQYVRGSQAYQAQNAKQQAKQQAEVDLKQNLEEGFQELEGLLPSTGSEGWGNIESMVGAEGGQAGTWGGLNRGAVERRERFTKQGFWLTDQVYTHFNKGTISMPKFEQMKEELAPRADLSERQNKARIDSLRRISALPKDISSKKADKIIDQEITKVKKGYKEQPKESIKLQKVEAGTPLPPDSPIVEQIMDQVGGNVKKAEELAKKLGYNWEE